jgi:hypothetical protein
LRIADEVDSASDRPSSPTGVEGVEGDRRVGVFAGECGGIDVQAEIVLADAQRVQNTQAGRQSGQWIVEERDDRAEAAALESPERGQIQRGHAGNRDIEKPFTKGMSGDCVVLQDVDLIVLGKAIVQCIAVDQCRCRQEQREAHAFFHLKIID